MPDTVSPDPLLVAGLRAALTGPLPLLAKGGKTPTPGMFPANTAGKKAAADAIGQGHVEEFTEDQTVTTTVRGKLKTTTKPVTLARLTPAGKKFAIEVVSPKAVLESLLPAVQKIGTQPPPPDPEAFRAAVSDAATACVAAIREAFDGLQQKVVAALPKAGSAADPAPVLAALRAALEKVEPVVAHAQPDPPAASPPASPPPPVPPPATVGHDVKVIGDEIVERVEHSARERSVGCDFGELFDALEPRHPGLTIGTFHDTLRALDDANRVRLSGWSRMIDDMPRPELALFVSHKVMYYAQPAR